MLLAKLLSKILIKGGIVLIDSEGQKYICGSPSLNNPVTLKLFKKDLNWKLVVYPDLYFGEAYTKGEIAFENGSLIDFLNIIMENIGRKEINIYSATLKRISHIVRFLTNFNLPYNSKKNVEHHYDRGEKLYDIFLDKKHRQYSCAYFKSETESLEDAQQNKINHIIKKLNLRPGQKVLDIGCGWGHMAVEIARQSKCEVTGISLSENQIKYCKNKARELKLDNQVNFELCDYRDVKGKFERIVTVGFMEHLGKKFYRTFFKKLHDLMTEDGISLCHTIGSTMSSPAQPWIQKYIFPGGITPSLSEITKAIENTNLIIADSESLIRHYNLTLKAWRERFMESRDKAKALYDESFCRMWEFYLASCESSFKYRDLLVYQLQLIKNYDAIPSNRRDYIYS